MFHLDRSNFQPGEWPWIVVYSRDTTNGSRVVKHSQKTFPLFFCDKLPATNISPCLYQGGCAGTLIADNWVVTAAHCFMTQQSPLSIVHSPCPSEFGQRKCPGSFIIQCQVHLISCCRFLLFFMAVAERG